jgi:transcriptional regulator with XRE-family HTH domain
MFNLLVKDAALGGFYAWPVETMGDRIRRLRIARKLTQPQFGKLVGVSKSAVSQWEDGSTKNLKLETLARVLEVLGTDLQYLVWGESRGPSSPLPQRRRSSSGT